MSITTTTTTNHSTTASAKAVHHHSHRHLGAERRRLGASGRRPGQVPPGGAVGEASRNTTHAPVVNWRSRRPHPPPHLPPFSVDVVTGTKLIATGRSHDAATKDGSARTDLFDAVAKSSAVVNNPSQATNEPLVRTTFLQQLFVCLHRERSDQYKSTGNYSLL